MTLSALGLLLAGCGSTAPVRRAPDYGPQQPVPTLVAGLVVDYGPEAEVEEVDATGASLGDIFGGIAKQIEDNPEMLVDAAGKLLESQAEYQYVTELAPTFQAKLASFMAEQGFQVEYDAARVTKMMENVVPGDHGYVFPQTADYTFHRTPVWGAGSSGSVAERLTTGRPREAFASVQIWFDPEGEDGGEEVTCQVQVKILDPEGDLVFDGTATGGSGEVAGLHQKKLMERAFDGALAQLRQPLIEEI